MTDYRFFGFLKKVPFHPDPMKRLKLTLVYCGSGILCNFFLLQVFCMPVQYAAAMCIAFFVAIVIFPFVQNKWLKNFLYFLLGMGVPICLYCIVFLSDPWGIPFFNYQNPFLNYLEYVLGILFLGLGLFAFIPFYLLWHIFKYGASAKLIGKMLILCGILAPCLVLIVYLFSFKGNYDNYISAWNQYGNTENFAASLPRNYFTERFLGVGFKCHTKLEFVYDGWRPPLHDPFLNIGLWIWGASESGPDHWGYYPPPWGRNQLQERLIWYSKLFPERKLSAWCPCILEDEEYFKTNLDSIARSGR